jgi:hypothetical protein
MAYQTTETSLDEALTHRRCKNLEVSPGAGASCSRCPTGWCSVELRSGVGRRALRPGGRLLATVPAGRVSCWMPSDATTVGQIVYSHPNQRMRAEAVVFVRSDKPAS